MMVELRSGTNTGGQEPRTTEGIDPNIPENIEVIYRIGSIDNFNWISEVRLIQLKLSIEVINWISL